MKVCVLLALLTVSTCGSNEVVTTEAGQSVTLTCTYNIDYYKALSVCWERGKIPTRGGCSNQLISTNGHSVTDGQSSRYKLLGRLDRGNVSLTILNVRESDAGVYGCRVDIPGWFNDEKHHFELVVQPAATTTSATTDAETTTEQQTEPTTPTQTEDLVTSTKTIPSSSISDDEPERSDVSLTTVVLVCVFFGLVALLVAGGLVIIARRWTRLNKTPQQQQQQSSRAWFSSTSSTLQLHNRGSAIENVYQIDADGGGGEYEYCP